MTLPDDLLYQFITTFYGSGNYSGKYWFVGMEEGGGNDLIQVTDRINTWKDLGGTELVDIFDFHIRINYPEYFTNDVKLQPTWKQQARIVLTSKGLTVTTDQVKAYQRDVIGRRDSETCLLELLPLPSPSTAIWNYDQWSDLPFLKSRKTYTEYCIPLRCDHIRSQIIKYQPRFVIFFGFGKSYKKYWHSIAGKSVHFLDKGDFFSYKSDKTLYIIAKHPAARGISNAYFESIGTYINQFS